MSEIFGSIWWMIVTLGVLVTFHEFGHYWVARRCGVKVLKFSVGFGRPIMSRRAKDGTVWQVGLIPLGGYVKMLDEREGEVPTDEVDQAFNRKSVGQRIAIVAAGPIFNLILAVFAFWVMYMVGIPEYRPVVGEVTGIAAEAGLVPEDEILSVDGEVTRTWGHTRLALVPPALDRDDVLVEVEDKSGMRRELELPLSQLGDDFKEEETLTFIGITPWFANFEPVIGEVSPDSAANTAGLRAGDRLMTIGGEEVPDWNWIYYLVQKHGEDGAAIPVTFERNGRTLEATITPDVMKTGFMSSRLVLGVTREEADDDMQRAIDRAYITMRLGPIEGFNAAVSETWRLTTATLGIIGRMVTGIASVRNISGPIGIARFANDSAQRGISQFLFFLGLISLSLGVLNLLPIPLLDGGHLLYYLIELVKGSPVSDQVQIAGQYVGLVALFGLISLGIVNDILRLVG